MIMVKNKQKLTTPLPAALPENSTSTSTIATKTFFFSARSVMHWEDRHML